MPWIGVASARAIAFASCVLVTSMAAGGAGAMAQATPTAAEVDIPDPKACEVEPRSYPFFAENTEPHRPATPVPLESAPVEPLAIPTGEAPDDETVEAITATVRESLACRNANDFLRAYALFTDDMLVSLFGGPATVDPDIQAIIADESVKSVPRRQRVALIAIENMVVLPDGRVGAVVETVNFNQTFRDYLIFVEDPESGRWLIDETRVMGDG